MSKEINIKVNEREYELIKDCISLAKQHDKYNSLDTLNDLYIKVVEQRDETHEINKMIERDVNRYIVTYPNESLSLSETNIIFSEKLTHYRAWALINKLMHEFTISTFDDDSIKPNDFIHFKDGQEKEFIKHCSKIRDWWACLAIYDLSNDNDLNKLKDLGHAV